MSIIEIGCCGAYCRTCIEWQKDKYPNERTCSGCKLGYENGERDINKTKCKIKICCFKEREFETCSDCSDYLKCEIILNFHSKNGYKYKKYKQSIEFIRKNGYTEFLKYAKDWKRAYGRLK